MGVSNKIDDKRSPGPRAGIALIVVLGFLSILILMAVALVTLTRTERLVSSYTSEGVRCRQLARGALDRAIADLNAYFDQYKLVRLTPREAVFVSIGDGGRVGSGTGLFRGSETNWLPNLYLVDPQPQYNVRSIWDNEAEWILIRDPTNPVTGSILGRIAYAIVDCTGLLDANVLGKDTVSAGVYRNIATRSTIGDIGLEQLPEALGDAAALAANRNYYHTFLTFREVLVFNDGYSNRYRFSERPVFSLDTGLRSVGPYSLSYDNGKWWNDVTWSWQTGAGNAVPNVNQWSAGQAAEVFQNLFGVNSALASQMADALQDYRDTDRTPRNTRSITVEAVPMLNEFILSGQVDVDASGNATLIIRIKPETWYPFPSRPPDGAYQFPPGTPTLSSTPGGGNITLGVVAQPGGAIAYGTVAPNNSAVIGAISYNGGLPQAWQDLTYQIALAGVTSGARLVIAPRMELIQLADASGAIVDEAVGPRVWPSVQGLVVPDPGGSVQFGARSLEINDPRLNHLANAWSAAGAGTPGQLNNSGSAERTKEGADMYVRDGPLESVAELGFICMSDTQPWTTIPLYGEGGRRLLSMFRAGSRSWLGNEAGRIWANGYLNPNTHFSSVLDAAFYGINLAEVPDHPITNLWQNVGQIAALRSDIVSILSTGQFYSGAGWVSARALNENEALAVGGLNNNQREAIIRNTHRLFSAYGNFYSVFVMAQTFAEGNTNVVMAEKRLAALVWHDPFPDEQVRRRRWFIRWFKWLEE